MRRCITIGVLVFSGSGWTIGATPQPPETHQSAQSIIETENSGQSAPVGEQASTTDAIPGDTTFSGLRHTADDDWRKGDMLHAFSCYQTILRRAGSDSSGQIEPADFYAMGTLSAELGHLDEAQQYYQKSLEMLQRQGLSASSGRVYVAAARLSEMEGAYSTAETQLHKAIDLLSHSRSPNDLQSGEAWIALSWHYSVLGRLEDASDAMHKANAVVKGMAENNPELVDFLDSQAALLAHMGRYAEAERIWNRAIDTADRLVGEDSPEYDSPILHLGQLDAAIGNYQTATKLLERFLAIERRAVPQGSISQAVSMGELGDVYVRLGQRQKAEPLFLDSLRLMDSITGKAPLAYAELLNYVGNYRMSQHNWSDAENQFRRALELRQPVLGKTPLVAQSMLSLSAALEKLKRKDEAKKLKLQAQQIFASQNRVFNSPDTVDVLSFRGE